MARCDVRYDDAFAFAARFGLCEECLGIVQAGDVSAIAALLLRHMTDVEEANDAAALLIRRMWLETTEPG